MNIAITWSPGDTWRKLGYYYYTNSLDYRAVIEQYPQWDVLTEPPVGAVMVLDVEDSRQLSRTTNSGFFPQLPDAYTQEFIFPFDTQKEYNDQAAKYSLYSILNYNECNGYTQDTPEAETGNQ